MPARIRRTRLLAIAVCIVTIVFLYERNAARVDQYASVLTHTVGGYGGSVLTPQRAAPPASAGHVQDQARKQAEKQEKQQQEQEAAAAKPPQDPIANPQLNVIPKPATSTSSSSSSSSSSTAAALQAATSIPEIVSGDQEGLSQHELETMLKYSAGKLPENGRDALGTAYKDKPDDGRTYMSGEKAPANENVLVKEKAPASEKKLPNEGGIGRVEDGAPKDNNPPVFWVKQKEHFPISTTIALPKGTAEPIPRIQFAGKGSADTKRLDTIKNATLHAWNGYRKLAWGWDEVKPVSGEPRTSFNGWGATLIDSLDTLWIMGMKQDFEDAVAKIAATDFTTSKRNDIPLFEVTIRYLGGLIAAYDISGQQYKVLLEKAVGLADVLCGAFDTPNRMPVTYYFWKPAFASQPHRAPSRVVLAELGSLTLEMTRLAQLTGDDKYYDAVARITNALEEWQSKTRIPGMWPTFVDASGCEKPVQMANEGEYRDFSIKPNTQDEIMIKSSPLKVDGKPSNGNDPALNKQTTTNPKSSQKEMEQNAANHEPGVGKIVGFDNPITEGTLDDPKAKQDALYGLGSSKAKRDMSEPAPLSTVPDAKQAVTKKDKSAQNTLKGGKTDDTALTGAEVCIPKGLGSASKHGTEHFTLGGASDSTYEYLPKEYLLLGGQLVQYKDMYLASAETAIKKLLFRPMTPSDMDILISGEIDSNWNTTSMSFQETLKPKGEHLTCFAGGMFAMGGKIFNTPEHIEIGRKLTEGCIWSYNSTASGIMPETFTVSKCSSKKNCHWDEQKYWNELDPYPEARLGFYNPQKPSAVKQVEDNPGPDKKVNVDAMVDDLAREDEGPNMPAAQQKPGKLPTQNSAMDKVKPVKNDLVEKKTPAKNDVAEIQAPVKPGIDGAALPLDQGGKLKPALPVGQKGAVQPVGADTEALPPGSGLDMPAIHKRQIIDDVDLTEKPHVAQPIPVPMNVDKQPTTSTSSTSTGPFIAGAPPATKTTAALGVDATGVDALATGIPPTLPLSHEDYVKARIIAEGLPPGFTKLISTAYILRPEAIESVFYMYRITGEQYWRDAGWKMFQAIQKVTLTELGNTAIHNVASTTPEQGDNMESFWLGETLKYFYLLFDDPDNWSLDDWVLNTEAHFFKRPGSAAAPAASPGSASALKSGPAGGLAAPGAAPVIAPAPAAPNSGSSSSDGRVI